MSSKKMNYYDPMGGKNDKCFTLVLGYLYKKLKALGKVEQLHSELDFRFQWKLEYITGPKQNNGYDCGVFCLLFMLYSSHQESLNFSQTNIIDLRLVLINHILRKPIWYLISFHQ